MKLENIAVLGAGTSGKGIIRSLAGSGFQVTFCEIDDEKVDGVLQDISDSLDQEIARWWITGGEKKLILSRIEGTTDMRKLAGAQVVIESIKGDIDSKQRLFEEMDRIFAEDTVLVSTSATICVSDITRRVSHPERVVGMHFSLPVPRRPVVELVCGRDTSKQSAEIAKQLAGMLKKTVCEVFEMPGLITTRIMIPYINEAIMMVMEGLSTPDKIDEAIRLGFKLPQGPLSMADEIGLDTLLEDMDRMYKAVGEPQYRPCPLLRRMVRENHLGKKSRRGFFCYDENGKATGCPKDRY